MNKLHGIYTSLNCFSYELDIYPTDSKAINSVTPASPIPLHA